MTERWVLALDGSTRSCSVALLELRTVGTQGASGVSWRLAAYRVGADGRGQAQALLGLVEEMLEEVGGAREDLGAVVVGTGPGTFTGVRIAVATARALSLALSVPVLGVSTLASLAAQAAATVARRELQGAGEEDSGIEGARARKVGPTAIPDRLVPVVDARRGQVFFTVYERETHDLRGEEPQWVRSTDYGACDASDLGEALTGRPDEGTMVIGAERSLVVELPPGMVFCEGQVRAEYLVLGQDRLRERGSLPQGFRLTPWLAARLGAGETGAGAHVSEGAVHDTARRLLEPGEVGAPESVRPIYVRAPDADIHITKMKDPWGGGLDAR